jgi:hypothetical protein
MRSIEFFVDEIEHSLDLPGGLTVDRIFASGEIDAFNEDVLSLHVK